MMTGTMDAPEARYIVYQGEKNGDDHFRADVPFEVTCPAAMNSKPYFSAYTA